jgi:hypothetical protein
MSEKCHTHMGCWNFFRKGKKTVINTSSKASKMSMLGWWMVQTTVRPVSTVLRTVRITIAAARASSPLVGSSMKMMEGFATSSTAIVNRFLCSVDSPEIAGSPTKADSSDFISTRSITCSTKLCNFPKQEKQTLKTKLACLSN